MTPESEIADHQESAPDAQQRVEALALLSSLGPAEYKIGPVGRLNSRASELSERGYFEVFRGIDEPTCLIPPIDWEQDPFGSQSWQAQLHTLRFLKALFLRYNEKADLSALRSACDIALDWIRSNERGGSTVSKFAWTDKVAGDRAPFLGYLLRSASFEKLLSRTETATLLGSALDHLEFLLDDTAYTRHSNHGLSQDLGLVLLSGYLDFFEDAAIWRRKGVDRFGATLSTHLSGEGLYLEHSPHYQWVIGTLIRHFNEAADLADERLTAIQAEVQSAAAWLVFPDGNTPPMGDSDYTQAPKWAREDAKNVQGLKLFRRAGIAVCRQGCSMLIASAGCHPHVHKHADELGFCLHEGGSLLLGEAGKYGYDSSDPAREYAQSAVAHNVLVVDDTSFPRAAETYGSALQRAGSGAGIYAFEGTNPLLRRQGVEHARLFVYQPGRLLVVVDKLKSSKPHVYTRLFHFGPGTQISAESDAVMRFGTEGIAGTFSNVSGKSLESKIAVGQRMPGLSGWMFPRYREWQPAPTVSLTSAGSSMLLGAALFIGPDEDVRVVESDDCGTAIMLGSGTEVKRIDIRAVPPHSLRITT